MDLDEDRPAEEGDEEETLAPVALRDEDRLLIIFAYMGPLALVSMAAGRNDFVRWHGRQGLVLSGAALLTFVVLRPIHTLFYRIWGFLGEIFLTIEIIVGFGFFMVAIFCLVRAMEGRRFRIPFLGDMLDRF